MKYFRNKSTDECFQTILQTLLMRNCRDRHVHLTVYFKITRLEMKDQDKLKRELKHFKSKEIKQKLQASVSMTKSVCYYLGKYLTLYVFSSWFHWMSHLLNLHYLKSPAGKWNKPKPIHFYKKNYVKNLLTSRFWKDTPVSTFKFEVYYSYFTPFMPCNLAVRTLLLFLYLSMNTLCQYCTEEYHIQPPS